MLLRPLCVCMRERGQYTCMFMCDSSSVCVCVCVYLPPPSSPLAAPPSSFSHLLHPSFPFLPPLPLPLPLILGVCPDSTHANSTRRRSSCPLEGCQAGIFSFSPSRPFLLCGLAFLILKMQKKGQRSAELSYIIYIIYITCIMRYNYIYFLC